MKRQAPWSGPLRTAFALILSAGVACAAHAGAPYPGRATPARIDLGELRLQPAAPLSVTLVLAMQDPVGAEQLLQTLTTPGDPQYRHFLTAREFAARFAPDAARVRQTSALLARRGLAVERSGALTLRVSGSVAAIEAAFAVRLHQFAVPAHGVVPGYRYHAPLGPARLPAELQGLVIGVAGLDDRPRLRPFLQHVPDPLGRRAAHVGAAAATGVPGSLMVADFAAYYDVAPLYFAGISGSGKTVGILTFASFTPSDAFAYWQAAGLTVDPSRLTVVDIDGGPGAPSDAGGSDETTLDVEQSGGIAPQASIIVYQAPNTSQGLVDVLAGAVEDNTADSLSMSWGQWEWFDDLSNSPVTDALTGATVSLTQAVHELLVRAGLQGQSVFAAAGDGGAYEVNHDLGCDSPDSPSVAMGCSQVLSVDYPASDPAITAAGGTTLPGTQQYCLQSACTSLFTVVISNEQVWGWDYLLGLCDATGTPDPVACGIFGVGGGGGVSIAFATPAYQDGLPGVQLSAPNQVLEVGSYYTTNDGITGPVSLPGAFAGRNVPDVSFNADPQTGYQLYYTSSAAGSTLAVQSNYGGTSFVAPQLNGVAALLAQSLGGRVGLLNAALYAAAADSHTNLAPRSLRPVAYGDNWYYFGSAQYNPGAGLGVLDVANFDDYLHRQL